MIGVRQEPGFSRTMQAVQAFTRAIVIGTAVIVGAGLVRNVTAVLTDAVHGPTAMGTVFAAAPSR